MVAAENVEKSEFSYFMAVAKNVVTSSAFVITVISVVVLFIIFVVIMIILSKKKNSEIDRFWTKFSTLFSTFYIFKQT